MESVLTTAFWKTEDRLIMPVSIAPRLNAILDYYRCLQEVPDFTGPANLPPAEGFFRFGPDVVCYGRAAGNTRRQADEYLFDASEDVEFDRATISLPFDVHEVVDNLRNERYVNGAARRRWVEKSWVHQAYYGLRPMLPISLRKHLQRIYLRNWDTMPFPKWPVDCSVDLLFEKLLVLTMQSSQTDRIPFIWFWPEGYQSCAIVTHDVETRSGRDFTGNLMNIDDAFGIKASFQIVPEKRYAVPHSYLEGIRRRGFEVNVQGLDHEGNLFRNRETFLKGAARINKYAREFGSRGFRSPVLYRNVDWLQDLDFSYDMSVPNVARLEAQRGGCCTVMPYFLPGGITELPLTMTEDYTLFHVLKDYSLTLWKQQMSVVLEKHGLMSFIIHPDYVTSGPAQKVYKELLDEICRLRSHQRVWVALPGEVDRWWRQRSEMNLARAGKGWRIEGQGGNRARVAHAILDGDRLRYELDATAPAHAR